MIKEKVKKINLLFLLKTAIGSAAAILLADRFGLAFSPFAGIITLLTIQNTKKETLRIAISRILSFFLAVAISFLVFTYIGYTSFAFGVFVLFFVGLCTGLNLKDGISMNAVLMTHFLIEKRIDVPLLLNEILLLLIGMGIGVLINLIMPKYRTRIRREQILLEEEIKRMLRSLAAALQNKEACLIQESKPNNGNDFNERNRISTLMEQLGNTSLASSTENVSDKSVEDEPDFNRVELMLEELLKKAYEEAGNTLLANTRYQVTYLEMRKQQIGVLKDIHEKIKEIPVILMQSRPMALFMEHTAISFHELNNAKELLVELDELFQYYKSDRLPVTREEFEYRAILFQILKDFEYFLMLKRNFVTDIEQKNWKAFWNNR